MAILVNRSKGETIEIHRRASFLCSSPKGVQARMLRRGKKLLSSYRSMPPLFEHYN